MKIRSHNDLDVYNIAFEAANYIFSISRNFPAEEKYALTDQIRRSSRSVCANIAEAFAKRRYPKSFISKISDAEAEAAETQIWIDFAQKCEYIDHDIYLKLLRDYNNVTGKLINMSRQAEKWTL